MELPRHGRLVRWAYFFTSKYDVPDRTTLCAFFWRAFVFMPLVWLLIVLAGTVVIVAGSRGVWFYPWRALGIAAALGTVFAFCVWMDEYGGHITIPKPVASVHKRIANSVLVQGAKSIKSSFCPIIELK